MYLLTAIILLPLLAAIGVLVIPRNFRFVIRVVALAAALVTMLLAIKLFFGFDAAPSGEAGFKYVHWISWVSSLGINYYVGVDGLNVGLILMGAIVAFAATCAAWEIQSMEKEFYVLLLVMIGGILGAFASLDAFFLYAFHEFALVPTFIMIGVWGRGSERTYATFQMTLYLSLGALVALGGLILLYLRLPIGARTFDLVRWAEYFRAHPMSVSDQNFVFGVLLFGFGILVSLWPFHTWAPLGYAAAPTPAAMLHAGVLKKFGLYGLIRIALPMMPEGAKLWVNVLGWLCLGNILFCGWVAMRQRDLNRLVGNSSVAHVGFCFLGIASLSVLGVTGAIMVMIAHGFLAALTFGLTGYLAQKTGTLDMDRLGGLLKKVPFIGTVLVMAMMAGCGLPGFANFVGEIMVLFGSWKTLALTHAHRIAAIAAWGGIMVGAVYMLRAIRGVLHGQEISPADGGADLSELVDANLWRKTPFALLLVCLLIFGFFPRILTDKIRPGAEAVIRSVMGPEAKPGVAAKLLPMR